MAVNSTHPETVFLSDDGVAQSPKNAHVPCVRSAFSSSSRLEQKSSFLDGHK
jgi:hypothetical protein